MKRYLKFKEIDGGIKLCKVDGYSKKQRKKINKMCLSLELNLENVYFILYDISNQQKKEVRKIKYVSYKKLKETALFNDNIVGIDIGYGNIRPIGNREVVHISAISDFDVKEFINRFTEIFENMNNTHKRFYLDEAHAFYKNYEKKEPLDVKKEDIMRIKRERAAKVQEMNKKRHPGFKK